MLWRRDRCRGGPLGRTPGVPGPGGGHGRCWPSGRHGGGAGAAAGAVVVVKLKTPRAPEPEAPRWQVMAMTVVWLGGSVLLLAGLVGNLVVRAVG